MSLINIEQGYFTSDGNDKTLTFSQDVEWMEVFNYTASDGATSGDGCKFYWQEGMGTSGLYEYHPAANQTLAVDSIANSFMRISGDYDEGAWYSVTAGTNATQPVYSTGTTTGLVTGAVVRLKTSAHTNIDGHDFSISNVVASTSFKLANALATAPGVIAGAAGYYRLVAPSLDLYKTFAPSSREIANITQASSAVVTTMVDHGYSVGQRIKFVVTSDSGMVEMNGLTGLITAITTSTFTVDIDSSAFTAFKYPLPAVGAFTPATCAPYGSSGLLPNSYVGALDNQSFRGMILTGGATYPAGASGDVVYWRAGTSSKKSTS